MSLEPYGKVWPKNTDNGCMRIRSSVVALIAVFFALTAGSAYVVGTLPEQAVSRDDWKPPTRAAGGFEATDQIGAAQSSDASSDASSEIGNLASQTVEPLTVVVGPDYDFLDDYPYDQRIYGVMTADGEDDEIADFVTSAGREPNLIGVTAGWAQDGYSRWYTERLAIKGAMPMISWEPWDASKENSVDQLRSEQPEYASARILAGDFDDYIDEWAQGIAEWGEPVMIRFAHEMNGYWYPWADGRNGNEPGSYAATWRYVHDRFTDAGATNAMWVWSPNVAYTASTPLPGLYPGDDYVDWIGVVGYFGHFSEPPSSQPGFDGVFGTTLARLAAITDKPVFVTETGAGPYGQLKAEWITDALDAFASDDRVHGFVWFNVNKEFDWRINSSPESRTAFARAVSDPAFADVADPYDLTDND